MQVEPLQQNEERGCLSSDEDMADADGDQEEAVWHGMVRTHFEK